MRTMQEYPVITRALVQQQVMLGLQQEAIWTGTVPNVKGAVTSTPSQGKLPRDTTGLEGRVRH